MHVKVDAPPHVLEDEIGLQLAAPDEGWRQRPDMDPRFTRPFRASIVARARFIEDLVVQQAGHGVDQYVILGAGLDTFAQRRPPIASDLAGPEVRPGLERAAQGARASGTPFISFFTPTEMLKLARDAGFQEAQHVSASTLAQRYFSDRTDGLRPPDNSEELLVAVT
jgi:O-methyltransferase involved in polyketide biosynthesis